jgi:hypothetical protein
LEKDTISFQAGEIDIIEGVHANEHNQVTWHTAPGTPMTIRHIFITTSCPTQVAL